MAIVYLIAPGFSSSKTSITKIFCENLLTSFVHTLDVTIVSNLFSLCLKFSKCLKIRYTQAAAIFNYVVSRSCHGNVMMTSSRWAESRDHAYVALWRWVAPNSKFTAVTACMYHRLKLEVYGVLHRTIPKHLHPTVFISDVCSLSQDIFYMTMCRHLCMCVKRTGSTYD